MLQNNRLKINEIIYVNHLIGNPRGSHTEYKTDSLFHYELLYKLSGEAVITYDTKTICEKTDVVRFLPNSALFCHAPKYTADVIEQGESINIAFTSDTPLPKEIMAKKYSCFPVLKQLFQKMHKYWYYKKDGYYYRCISLFYEILATIAEAEADYLSSDTCKLIMPAIEYIDRHFTEQEIDCDMLADLCRISHTYMTKLFRKHFGMPPSQYINSKRIQYACDLLKTKQFSVSEVAANTGFSNTYYFSRVFKAHTGVCPSKY